MADVTFLNLLRGNRISGFLRLKMTEGVPYRMATDYTYAELPVFQVQGMDGVAEDTDKVKHSRTVNLVAPALMAPIQGHKALISVNPVVFQYATAPSLLLIDSSNTPQQISIPIRTFRELALSELEWLCRVYLIN